jgi:hypothetical protein
MGAFKIRLGGKQGWTFVAMEPAMTFGSAGECGSLLSSQTHTPTLRNKKALQAGMLAGSPARTETVYFASLKYKQKLNKIA